MKLSGISSTIARHLGVIFSLIYILGLVACGSGSESTLALVKQHIPAFSSSQYTVQLRSNVAYGPLPGEQLDICQPEGAATARPGIILIHGGGWLLGDKQNGTAMCKSLAALGFLVINVNYRLTNTHQLSHEWPAQVIDVQLAVRWMRFHASQLGLNSKSLCAYGTSAGGHLAVFLGVLAKIHPGDEAGLYANESPQVSCVVDDFGPTNLANAQDAAALQIYVKPLFGGKTFKSDPALYRDASPIFAVSPQSAPMLIVQGTQDSVVLPDNSLELLHALQKNHVPVQYISYKGEHSFGHTASQTVQTIYQQEVAYLVAHEHP